MADTDVVRADHAAGGVEIATMLAAVAERYGPPEVVSVRAVPVPVPGSGQARVRVRASSLNPLDAKLRSGALHPFLRLGFPAVLGFDVAGDVDAVGPDTMLPVGTRVYGRIERPTGGAHAQYAVLDANVLDRIPERLSYAQAAALPLAGTSALQALRYTARLRAGQSLLVVGGAGGVGSMAVQIGVALAARVTAVVSAAGAEVARRAGAHTVLDYTRGDLERHTQEYHVVFDTVSKQPFPRLARHIGPRGEYVTTGFGPELALRWLAARLGLGPRVHVLVSRANGVWMRELSAYVAQDRLEPVVDSEFPLERIQDAYRRLEQGHAHGKIVLTVS